MSLNFVSNPYPYYNARNQGKPIFNGKIYVGVPDLDPTIVANQLPLTAKQQDGTKVPIAQPVSTNSGGYAVDSSGSLVVLLVDGNYSIRINDNKGQLALEQANVNDGVPLTAEGGVGRVNTVVDLRLLEPTDDGQSIFLVGYTVEGLGSGDLYAILNDPSPDNGGTKFKTPEGNSWNRPDEFGVNVQWFGAIGDGTINDSPAIQAAEDYSHPISKQLIFPGNHIYRIDSTISRGQHSYWVGEQSVDTGTQLWFYGPDGDNAVEAIGGTGDGISRIYTKEIRILDKRTSPTGGDGLHISNFDNRVNVIGCFFGDFPGAQLNITSPAGTASDSVMIDDVWLFAGIAGSIGINIERVDNVVQIRNIKCDTLAGTKCINIDSIANEAAVLDISNIKHEPNNTTSPTITIGSSHGNILLQNVVQRNASGTASDIIVITNSTAARVNMVNIAGDNHNSWGTGAQLVTIEGPFAQTIAGSRIDSAYLGVSGRIVRDIAGNGNPEGVQFGNIGDVWHRLDSAATLYVKSSGTGTNSGWFLIPRVVFGNTTFDLPSIPSLSFTTFTVTAAGAVVGDSVTVGFGGSASDIIYTGQVTSNNTVKVLVFNPTSGAVDIGNQAYTIRVIK